MRFSCFTKIICGIKKCTIIWSQDLLSQSTQNDKRIQPITLHTLWLEMLKFVIYPQLKNQCFETNRKHVRFMKKNMALSQHGCMNNS